MIKKLRRIAKYLRQLNSVLAELLLTIQLTRKIIATLISICLLLQGDPLGIEMLEVV